MAYFTPTTEINVDNFLRCFIGNINEFEDSIPKRVFGNRTSASRESILAMLDFGTYPEVAEGLKEHINAYGQADFTLKDFILIHSDFYASDPINYAQAVSRLWK
jgi:hypothetical protein